MSKTYRITAVAMMVAIMAIFAQIAIPIPISPVPLTLQTAGLIIAMVIFNWRESSLAMLVYILLGSVGVPVFSAGKAGLAVLAGPTGGYLYGFIAAALIGSSLLAHVRANTKHRLFKAYICVAFALAVMFCCGMLHFCLIMHVGLKEAFMLTILPYLPLDILKIAAFTPLAWKVKQSLHKQYPKIF